LVGFTVAVTVGRSIISSISAACGLELQEESNRIKAIMTSISQIHNFLVTNLNMMIFMAFSPHKV
jgi:Ni,Fe-hydrogenase III large subunit